jgi:hypothetical protein
MRGKTHWSKLFLPGLFTVFVCMFFIPSVKSLTPLQNNSNAMKEIVKELLTTADSNHKHEPTRFPFNPPEIPKRKLLKPGVTASKQFIPTNEATKIHGDISSITGKNIRTKNEFAPPQTTTKLLITTSSEEEESNTTNSTDEASFLAIALIPAILVVIVLVIIFITCMHALLVRICKKKPPADGNLESGLHPYSSGTIGPTPPPSSTPSHFSSSAYPSGYYPSIFPDTTYYPSTIPYSSTINPSSFVPFHSMDPVSQKYYKQLSRTEPNPYGY